MGKPTVNLNLAPAIRKAIAQMAYAENASEGDDVVKMTIQTALNRYLSGRGEFAKGPGMKDILKEGYYAVKKNSPLYQQAVSGKFPDKQSQIRYAQIEKLLEAILADKDYGQAMFYFTPEERERMIREKEFDFKKVKPTGKVGKYETYSY